MIINLLLVVLAATFACLAFREWRRGDGLCGLLAGGSALGLLYLASLPAWIMGA